MTRSVPSIPAADDRRGADRPDVVRGGSRQVEPTISLVVSTVGRPENFRRLVDSVLEEASAGVGIELIVVDQGATEETRQILDELDLPFPWTYTRSAMGASLGRNVGLRLARARYVMFPDDDAWFPGTTLRAAVGHLESHPDHDGFCTQLRDGNDELSMLRWAPTAREVTLLNHHRTSIGSTMLFRTDVAMRSGGFDESMGPGADGWFGSCEDSDFLLRIIEDGSTIWYDPDTVMHHRDARRDGDSDAVAKSLAYGCGQGHLWRSHVFPPWLIVGLLIRRFVGSLLLLVAGQPGVGRAHRAWVRGAINGYFGKQPMGLDGSVALAAAGAATAPSRAEFGKSFSWRLLISPLGTVATFSLTAVAARALDVREVTLLYALLAALMIGPILSRFGLNQSAVQQIASTRTRHELPVAVRSARRHVRSSLLPAALAAPVVGVLFAFAAGVSANFVLIVGLTALVLFTESIRLTISDVLTGLGHTGWGAVLAHQLRAVVVIIAVGVYLVLFPDELDFERLLTIMASVSVVLLVLGYQRLFSLPVAAGDASVRQDLASLLRIGLPFLVVDLVAVIVARGDVWLAARAFTDEEAAFYSTGSVLAVQIATPIGLASLALAPIVAGYVAQHRLADLERLVRTVTTAAAVLMLPLVAVTIVAGDSLLTLAYGDRYADAYPYLVILMIGNLALTTLGTSAVVLVMGSRQKVAMTISAIWFAVAAPTAAALAFLGGPMPLAFASASTTVGLYCLMAFAVWVRAGITVFPYWRFWNIVSPRDRLLSRGRVSMPATDGGNG